MPATKTTPEEVQFVAEFYGISEEAARSLLQWTNKERRKEHLDAFEALKSREPSLDGRNVKRMRANKTRAQAIEALKSSNKNK